MSVEETKRERLQEVAPHIWDMYRLLFEVRVVNHENRLNFFLAVDALFMVGYLSLFEDRLASLSIWYVIPFLLLLFPAVALLVDFITRGIYTPWFDEEGLTNALDHHQFYVRWLTNAYVCASMTWEFQKRASRLLKWCFRSVILSLAWLLALFVLHLCETDLTGAERMLLLGLVGGGIVGVVYFAWMNLRGYREDKWEKQVGDQFQHWIKKGEHASGESDQR